MDELSLLVGDSEAAIEAASESPVSSLPASDFTGSLDYIDSLANRVSFSVGRRDIADITTAGLFDYLSPVINPKAVPGPIDRSFEFSTDFRPLRDGRLFDPEGSYRRPASLVRTASDVVAPSLPNVRNDFPPDFVNPLDPSRDVGDLNRTFKDIERRISRHPFAFRRRSQVVICLKRKIRKGVMHAFGFAGLTGFRPQRRNYWSRVIC